MVLENTKTEKIDHLSLGNQLKKEGKLKEAIAAYQALADTLSGEGKIDEAISYYHQVLEIEPEPKCYHNLGQLLVIKGEIDAAISCYLKAIEIQPNWGQPYLRLRHLPLNQNQLEAAIAVYRRAAKQQPNYHEPHLSLGQALTTKGLLTEASEYYQTTTYCLNLAFNRDWVKNNWHHNNKSKGPDFIIIGAEKSGTSSLHSYITQHPKVLVPAEKEIHFFTYNFDNGLDWYQAHFPPILETTSDYITGEASTSYIACHNQAPQRILKLFPQVKLLAVLRNPVERAISNYHQLVRLGKEKRSLEEVMTAEMEILAGVENIWSVRQAYWSIGKGSIWHSLYVYFIAEWLKFFPQEQLLILNSENLFYQPEEVMKQVYEFLGLADYQLPNYPVYNAGGDYSQPDPSIHQKMTEFFQPYNQRLENLLGIKFNW